MVNLSIKIKKLWGNRSLGDYHSGINGVQSNINRVWKLYGWRNDIELYLSQCYAQICYVLAFSFMKFRLQNKNENDKTGFIINWNCVNVWHSVPPFVAAVQTFFSHFIFDFRFLFILAYFSFQLTSAEQSTRERIAVSARTPINHRYN